MREVQRCSRCGLNQFVPASQRCRRCRAALPVAAQAVLAPAAASPSKTIGNGEPDFAMAFVLARLAHRWSQRQAAEHMGLMRTYLARLEQGMLLPMLPNVERLAAGYGLTTEGLVQMAVCLGQHREAIQRAKEAV